MKKKLLDLKKEIGKAKDSVNRLEGRREHLVQELEEEWGCASVKEAKAKLSELKQEIKAIDHQIEDGITELEEKYDV